MFVKYVTVMACSFAYKKHVYEWKFIHLLQNSFKMSQILYAVLLKSGFQVCLFDLKRLLLLKITTDLTLKLFGTTTDSIMHSWDIDSYNNNNNNNNNNNYDFI